MMQIEENGHQMGFLRKFMMENAGAAAAKRIEEKYPIDYLKEGILVFAGLGNNGGDGLVIARHLAGYGANVTVFLLGEPDNIRSEECSWNWSLLEKMKSVKLLTGGNLENLNNLKFNLIIDGILGTGISGEIREPQASAITFINKSNAFKLAVDIPSGVDPDTGNKNLPHATANITVTFHRMKVGMPKAKDVCGKIFVEKIGIPPEAEIGVL
jgi:NAD(P)H-hydrate epimerase